MGKYKLLYLLFTVACWSCTHDSKTGKYQNKRDNVINVQDKVKEIGISEEDVLIGAVARLYLMDDYLIIVDSHSFDKLIHLFDKNKFSYITGIAEKGQGPNEITNIGYLATDEVNRKFYVNDHGKQRIFSYDLDSVLVNPLYTPEIKMKMNEKLFPDNYHYFNDTLSMGLIIEPIGVGDFAQFIGKWNMNTGEIRPMKYKHPDIKKKRITFAISVERNIYVECYAFYDLMTIGSLDGGGDLKYNIYGPKWSSRQSEKSIHHYGKVEFCKDKILAAYSGGDNLTDEYYPTRFLVFDINGDYIKTLETGYKISDYCYDKKSNRIIMNLNDADIQFAYLELDGLIE
jgi:hypothetical protein